MTQQPSRRDSGASVPAGQSDVTGGRPTDVKITSEPLPDILEVFGSKPLVQPAPTAASAVPAAASSTQQVPDAVRATSVAVAWGAHLLDDPLATPDDDPSGAGRSTRIRAAQPRPINEAPADAADAKALDALRTSVQQALDGQAQLVKLLQSTDGRLAQLEQHVDALNRQTAFLPPKLRGLGQKVEELASALSDNRTRDLLRDMFDLGDLVETAMRALPEEVETSHPLADSLRFFHALRARFGQILETHKVRAIDVAGAFDPELHQAVESVPVYKTEEDGSVVEVYRRGYRTEHQVLRYAEVSVGRHTDRRAGEPAPGEPALAQATLTPPARPMGRRGVSDQNSASPGPKPDSKKDDR